LNSFLIIIAHTPGPYRTAFRDLLFARCLESLQNIQYDLWECWVISDETKQTGNIKFLDFPAVTKKEKIIAALDHYTETRQSFDYVMRLDDDDLISPHIFQRMSGVSCDAIYDPTQVLYDLVNDRFFFARYPWYANSVIHKMEHALHAFTNPEPYMLAGDHDQTFHIYYQDKHRVVTHLWSPAYVRIYHPDTASINKFTNAAGKKNAYRELLKRPRSWNRFRFWLPLGIPWFNSYRVHLRELGKRYEW